MNKYVFNWGGKYPLYIGETSSNRFIEIYKRLNIMGKRQFFIISVNNEVSGYSVKKDRKFLREVNKRYATKEFKKKLFSESKKVRNKYWQFAKKIRNTNLEKISNREILKLYTELNHLMSQIFSMFESTRPEYQEYIEKRLKSLTKKYFKDEKIINILITPTEIDEIIKANNELLLFCAANPSDKELLQFGLENIWLFPSMQDKASLMTFLKERKGEAKELGMKDIKRNITESERSLKKRKKEQEKLLQQANDKELRFLSELFQDISVERARQKKCWMDGFYYMDLLVKHIAKKKTIPKQDIVRAYKLEDVEKLILEKKRLDKKIIEFRKKKHVFVFKEGETFFYEGSKADKIINPIIKNQTKLSEIKGTPAHGGKAKGRIVFVPNSDLESLSKNIKEFKKGDILISQMTQPNMVILVEKAGAIITDEGGICSHAAVISREFKVPCIVGTSNVTKLLKTGDYVEVDADKGTVKKLKKK